MENLLSHINNHKINIPIISDTATPFKSFKYACSAFYGEIKHVKILTYYQSSITNHYFFSDEERGTGTLPLTSIP